MTEVLPRVMCAECLRDIAASPAAGTIGKGRLFRHDSAVKRRSSSGELISCPGSLSLVDLPHSGVQLSLDFPLQAQESLFSSR